MKDSGELGRTQEEDHKYFEDQEYFDRVWPLPMTRPSGSTRLSTTRGSTRSHRSARRNGWGSTWSWSRTTRSRSAWWVVYACRLNTIGDWKQEDQSLWKSEIFKIQIWKSLIWCIVEANIWIKPRKNIVSISSLLGVLEASCKFKLCLLQQQQKQMKFNITKLT